MMELIGCIDNDPSFLKQEKPLMDHDEDDLFLGKDGIAGGMTALFFPSARRS